MEMLGELLDPFVRWVEDRYGTAAAWVAAIGGFAAVLGIVLLTIWYLAS